MPTLNYKFLKGTEKVKSYIKEGICLRIMGKDRYYLEEHRFPNDWDSLEIGYYDMPASNCGFWYAALPAAFQEVMDIQGNNIGFCMTPETPLNQVMLAMFHARIMLRPEEVPCKFAQIAKTQRESGIENMRLMLNLGLTYLQAYTLVTFPIGWLAQQVTNYHSHLGGGDAACYDYSRITVEDWIRWIGNPVEMDKQIRSKMCRLTYPDVISGNKGYTKNILKIFVSEDYNRNNSMQKLYFELANHLREFVGGGQGVDLFGRAFKLPTMTTSPEAIILHSKGFLESRGIV